MRFSKVALAAVVIGALSINSIALFAQVRPDSKRWRILAGSIEAIDGDKHQLTLWTRSGTETTSKNWTDSAAFRLDDLNLRSAGDAVQLQLSIQQNTKLWAVKDSKLVWAVKDPKLQYQELTSIQKGQSVLVELQSDQSWLPNETQGEAKRLIVASVVLLQACIEASCRKANCKDKKDCKDNACNCPQAK